MKHRMVIARVLLWIYLWFFSLPLHPQDAQRGGEIYGARCLSCHGDRALGSVDQQTPRLGGQHDWYIVDALTSFENGARRDTEGRPHARGLSDENKKDLGAYIASLTGKEVEHGDDEGNQGGL